MQNNKQKHKESTWNQEKLERNELFRLRRQCRIAQEQQQLTRWYQKLQSLETHCWYAFTQDEKNQIEQLANEITEKYNIYQRQPVKSKKKAGELYKKLKELDKKLSEAIDSHFNLTEMEQKRTNPAFDT